MEMVFEFTFDFCLEGRKAVGVKTSWDSIADQRDINAYRFGCSIDLKTGKDTLYRLQVA